MKKRTAILIAGGLVASMMAGVVALTIGRGIVGRPAAQGVAKPKPIIKTETTVVTVKKRRPGKAAGPVTTITLVRPGSASTGSAASSSHGDDGADSHEDGGNGGDD
jgi:hypothetical protein